MQVITARNVQAALPKGLDMIYTLGERRESRNGPVLQMPTPVTTLYEQPTERVVFYPERDANPFFHLFESLWMLAGRNDVAYPAHYVKTMKNFSDDGVTFNGAYGYRWRRQFAQDQLSWAVRRLRENPDDRRVVISMWDANADPEKADAGTRDVPCNLSLHLSINSGGSLDMTVFNRSNDIVWGCYGANAVHFSVLQEYLASAIGVPVGRYWQVSDNWHGYLDTLDKVRVLADARIGQTSETNPYVSGLVEPFPIMSVDEKTWMEDLTIFLDEGPIVGLRDRFFRRVAGPMYHAHAAYSKRGDSDRFDAALEILEQCLATDWRLACQEWVCRRREKALQDES